MPDVPRPIPVPSTPVAAPPGHDLPAERRTYVGIDVAARTLAVVVLSPVAARAGGGQHGRGVAGATAPAGRRGRPPAGTRVVLEATGTYWVGLATDLTDAGWTVSVVPPASVRYYAQARLRRAKTDAVDAYVLASYGRDLHPLPWTPPPAEVRALQLLLRQREDLVALRTQTSNRQHALAQLPAVPAEVQQPLAALRAVLDEQIATLEQAITQRVTTLSAPHAADVARLDGIAGVGLLTAAVVLVETAPLLAAGATPKQVVAYAGLDPAPHQSGTSVRGASQLSKTGTPRLRQALYMAALSAKRPEGPLRTFYTRLLNRGKHKRVALVAVARKLLVLMVTLMQRQRTYDPTWATRARHAT